MQIRSLSGSLVIPIPPPLAFVSFFLFPLGCDSALPGGLEKSFHRNSQTSRHNFYPFQCENETSEGDGLQGQILLLGFPCDPPHFTILHLTLVVLVTQGVVILPVEEASGGNKLWLWGGGGKKSWPSAI